MATVNDQALAVARVYADALLELAEGQGAADEVREEMESLAELYEADATFREFLTNPAIDQEERKEGQEKLFRGRLLDLTVDTLQVLNEKDRSHLMLALTHAYRAAHDELRRRIEVSVVSAKPLTEDQRARLARAVERRTGRTPSFEERVDPALLGGLVVRIGDEKTDGSVATRLNNLSEALLARASREIHSGTYVEGTNG